MQPKTHRLISVLLLLALLLTLAAPALAQEPATAPLTAAPEATCSPLSQDQQATFDRLAQLKEAGQLDSAGYDLFTKLGEQAGCSAPAAAPDAIDAVTGYAFSQSFSTYTELTGDTVFTVTGAGGTLDDGISATQPIGFTFNFGGTNYTGYRVNSNGWLGFGAPTQTLGFTALGGLVDNIIAFVNRDLNNVGAVYSRVTEGTAPNRIHKIQAKNFYRYNTASMTGNAQIWLYETSNVVEIRYGAFATNWDAGTVVQVGLRGVGTSDVRSLSGSGATTWSNPTVGTSSGAFMQLALTVTPASGQVYTWTPQPLAVTLASFTAQGSADRITVTWETVSEFNSAGFNLYRGLQADGSDQALLTYVASQAPGSTQGAAYSYVDAAVEAGQTYWYWLEDVDLSGATTLHGPVSATVQTPTAVGLADFEAAAGSMPSFAGLALAAGLAAAGGLVWRRRRQEAIKS